MLRVVRRPRLARLRDERGSMSLYAVVATMATILLLGLVVDGGGRIQAQQHADATAREAARQAGQELQAGPAIRGHGARADLGAGRRMAQRYLTAANVSGEVEVRSNTSITVTTHTSYRPIFLAAIGIGSVTTHGYAEARIAEGILQ